MQKGKPITNSLASIDLSKSVRSIDEVIEERINKFDRITKLTASEKQIARFYLQQLHLSTYLLG